MWTPVSWNRCSKRWPRPLSGEPADLPRRGHGLLLRGWTRGGRGRHARGIPAYAARIDELRGVLAAYGFDPAGVHVTGMLEAIQGAPAAELAPAGAAYISRYRMKRRGAAAH